MVPDMNEVKRSSERLRARIRTGGVSLREIARHARVSDSTVRRFVEHGSANLRVVTQIEQAVSDLASAESAPSASSDSVQ
jgi:DNA invertase Pin-like site-specific DNA recombinase